MPDRTSQLGGRLPLVDPETLTGEQRNLYDRTNAVMVPWAERVGFQSKTADGRFIGPFNPMLFSPEIAKAFLELQVEEEKVTSLSDRVRQVVILSVGSVWKAAYELYAHAAAGRNAGFSDNAVRALAAGQYSAELNDEELVAQRFTLQLTAERYVGDELYRAAADHFSEKGLVDMLILAGCYQVVCSVLNAFAVPAPDSDRLIEEE
jgi:4-carboxymuconolactone decarboxylase